MAPKRADRDSKNFGHGSNTDGTPQAEAAEGRTSYNSALRAEARVLRPRKPGLASRRMGLIQRQQRLRRPHRRLQEGPFLWIVLGRNIRETAARRMKAEEKRNCAAAHGVTRTETLQH